MKIHYFHKNRTFCPKVHFGPFGLPKPSIFLVLWKDFRLGPEMCAFSRKVALFANFDTIRENHFFMIFMIFMEKHDFSNLATGTGSQKCEKVHFHDFHGNFMKITKNPGIFRISRNVNKIIKKIQDGEKALFSQ